jgi:hypothetical protein
VNAEDLLSRSLRLLQGAIRASGHTQTEIDDLIGRRRGYLSHVFQRRVDLKVIDLVRALEALGIDPRRFFAALVASGPSANVGVLQLIADRPEPPATDRPAPESEPTAATEPVLEERVRTALRSILTGLGEQGLHRRSG